MFRRLTRFLEGDLNFGLLPLSSTQLANIGLTGNACSGPRFHPPSSSSTTHLLLHGDLDLDHPLRVTFSFSSCSAVVLITEDVRGSPVQTSSSPTAFLGLEASHSDEDDEPPPRPLVDV